MQKKILFLLLVTSLLLTACGGSKQSNSSGGGAGDPAAGKTLYESATIGANNAPGCASCHSRDKGVVLVGPSHADIGTRAGSAVAGQSAEDYLRESIVKPDAHIAEGFTAGIMYQNYGKDLTGQQINDLVAYMLTLK